MRINRQPPTPCGRPGPGLSPRSTGLPRFGLPLILLLTAAVTFFPRPGLSEPLTLEECLKIGLSHNLEVLSYTLSVDEAGQGVNEAWGAFLPTLSINYSAAKQNNLGSGGASLEDGAGEEGADGEGIDDGGEVDDLVDDALTEGQSGDADQFDTADPDRDSPVQDSFAKLLEARERAAAAAALAAEAEAADGTGESAEPLTRADYLSQTNNTLTVRLTQPLFTGLSGISGLKRARYAKEYQELDLQYLKNQLAREIRLSFYAWLYARERAALWRDSVKRLEMQSSIAAAWVEQRMATRLRLLENDVELSNARHEVIRAASEEAIARANLRDWLNFHYDRQLEISGSLADTPLTAACISVEGCREMAVDRRVEMAMAKLNIMMAREDANLIASRNLPQVDLVGSYVKYQREFDDATVYPDERENYYSVMLNVSFTPFQGGRTLFAWRKQKIAISRMQVQLERQRNMVATEVETRYQQLTESAARIANIDDTLVEARAAYEMAARSAELGVVALDELLDAELRLTRTENNMIDARHALAVANARLIYATGNR